MKKILCAVFSALAFGTVFTSCAAKKSAAKSIAVFAPGIFADSPTYSMLADGVKAAVDSYNDGKSDDKKVKLDIIEAGTNQAEWSTKLTAVAASESYDLIVTSNLAGYIAGLMTKSGKLGLIAGQEYPVMNNVILPGFEEGAKAAHADASVDFRIVGNWYSAAKGGELADAMWKNKIDVILPICGGASQGVIASAVANNFYLVWFDSNGFSRAPKNVIGSAVTNQHKMAEEMTLRYLNSEIEWGAASTVGIKEGFVDFVQDDPLYIQNVPDDVRKKIGEVIESIKDGSLSLPQEF